MNVSFTTNDGTFDRTQQQQTTNYLPTIQKINKKMTTHKIQVIAVDPRSKTSPKHVLDRWASYMTIVRWNDRHFMSHQWMPENRDVVNENDATAKFVLHRERQRHFYPTCLAALRAANRTWTMVIDIDEYAVQNHNYFYYKSL